MKIKFNEAVGAVLGIGVVYSVIYAAVFQSKEVALTALVGLAGGVLGYFVRGKVQSPTP